MFLLLMISSCKTLNTNLSIPEKKIPLAFNAAPPDSTNIAAVNWRQYFDDPILVNLIDTALKGNVDLQMAFQRIEATRARVKMASGAMLPQLGLNVNGGIRKFGLYTMDGAGNISTEITPGQMVPINLPDMYLGVNAAWEIDLWGKLQNLKKSALASYFSTQEGVNLVVSNLVSEIAISYFQLMALDNQLEIIQQTIQKQREALEVIRIQKETGRANELAVQQFQSQLLNSQAMELKAKQQILEQENLLNFLLGRYPQKIKRNITDLFKEASMNIASGIPSQMLSNRPDIREAELQVEASKFELKAAKAAFFPNLNITAGLGFQAFNPDFLFTTPASLAYSALGGLIAPLVNKSALKAQFNSAKANQITAMYHYQKTILNAYVEVVNELSNMESLNRIHSLKKLQTEVLTQSVGTSTELYKAAKANYLEVLLAQQNSLQTQLDLIDILQQQRMAKIKLYKALGGGWR